MMAKTDDSYLIHMFGINKAFHGVKALEQIELKLSAGEVLGLIGENGAGKSTLMKIMNGVYKRDAGTMLYQGKEVEFANPRAAKEAGLSIVHQELSLELNLNITENIFLGKELPKTKLGLIDWKKAHAFVAETMERLHLGFDPHMIVKKLTVGQMQIVEIVKAIAFNVKVVVMDEPTSALSDKEVELLFNIITELKKSGVGIVYISHRLNEIFQITDKYAVLRDGRLVGGGVTADVSKEQLIRMMVGREIGNQFPPMGEYLPSDTIVLETKRLTGKDKFKNIDLQLHKGEILGLTGLMGAGRTELVRAIFGADPIMGGELYVNGEKASYTHCGEAIARGIGLVPEDRRRNGLFLKMNVRENITLVFLKRMTQLGFYVAPKAEAEIASAFIERLKIKARAQNQCVAKLSGGNQQKIVISKWLVTGANIMIFDEPTRGLDVGAKQEVYELIRKLSREENVSIIMISSELPEILALCDRTLVMHEGEMMGCLSRDDITEEKVMYLATGGI